jgi:hypothetical protein
MNKCADDVRIACPLFQGESGGVTPTSALQIKFGGIGAKKAVALNELWHSRMPLLTNWQMCFAYAGECDGLFYVAALWGPPVAREFNGRGYLELRRMAIAPDAPKNTASRMLGWMCREIKRNRPDICKLVSYQDTAVHQGTIYRASGWRIGGTKRNIGTGWNTRLRNTMQSTSDKVRWELDIRPQRNMEESQNIAQQAKGEMAEEQLSFL